MKKKIIISVNSAWNIINFRSNLIKGFLNSGYEVIAIAPYDKYVDRINDLGCKFIPIEIDNGGYNIIKDLKLLFQYYIILKREMPCIFLGFTIKPNIYGSIASNFIGIPVINNIAGLGNVFVRNTYFTRFVRFLYKISLSKSKLVFFQNEFDRSYFIETGIVNLNCTERLPGSGVDLSYFKFCSIPLNKNFKFLLVSRMLWDKGVGEFVEAARILKKNGINAEFCLLGFLDVENPAAITTSQMNKWIEEEVITYLGVSDNVLDQITLADCIVLPSYYREGVPRSLLEAASIGRPIITTDFIGCREVVQDGINGFLVKPKDTFDLVDKLKLMLDLSFNERKQMGIKSREIVEKNFDEKVVIEKYKINIDLIIRENNLKNI